MIAALVYTVQDSRDPTFEILPTSERNAALSVAISAVAMILDLVILVAMWCRLYTSPHTRASPTGRVLLHDGTFYFLTSLALNTASVVLGGLSLKGSEFPGLDHFSFGPIVSGVLSTIVASRAVRNLSDHMAKKEIILLSNQRLSVAVSDIQPLQMTRPAILAQGIKVQTDTIVTCDDTFTDVLDLGLDDEDHSMSSIHSA